MTTIINALVNKPTQAFQRCAAYQAREQLVRLSGALHRMGRSLLRSGYGASAQMYFERSCRLMGLLRLLTGVLDAEAKFTADAWDEWRQLLQAAFKEYQPPQSLDEFKAAHHLLARMLLVNWGNEDAMLARSLPHAAGRQPRGAT